MNKEIVDKNKDKRIKAKIEKDKAVKREIARLTALFKDIEKNRRLSTNGLIAEAAFMKITLQELKQEIDKEGPIDLMPQGDYSILREHPALKSYNTMVQRYAALLKQLTDLLPKEVQKEVTDSFDDFLNSK